MQNKREEGNKLEEYVVSKLSVYDPTARRSSTSGGKGQHTDVICQDFIIECKKRNTSDITIKRSTWYKTCAGVVNGKKIPLYVLENKHNDRWVVLDLEDFFDTYIDGRF